MGTPKALLRLGGCTFFDEVREAVLACGLAPRVLVTNRELAPRLPIARGEFEVVINEKPEEGMLRSVQLGAVRMLEQEPHVDGAFLLLLDNPGKLQSRLATLLDEVRQDPARVIAAAYSGKRGHPLWLPAGLLRELIDWRGEDGVRGFLKKCRVDVLDVETAAVETLRDIDTPDDYEAIQPTE